MCHIMTKLIYNYHAIEVKTLMLINRYRSGEIVDRQINSIKD